MFHTYVIASSGRKIDFDRARPLMDDLILAHVEPKWTDFFRLMQKEPRQRPGETHPDLRPLRMLDLIARGTYVMPTRTQFLWDEYCRMHRGIYLEPFEPDVSLTWDT